MKDKLVQLVAKTLKIDENEVSESTSPNNTQQWDSLTTMILITEIEESFKVTFSVEEMMQLKSVKDIRALLRMKEVENV